METICPCLDGLAPHWQRCTTAAGHRECFTSALYARPLKSVVDLPIRRGACHPLGDRSAELCPLMSKTFVLFDFRN